MSDNIYRKLSDERKKLQEAGRMPAWWSTGGWQLFKEKYLYQAADPYEQYMRIARTLAAHTKDPESWTKKFFDIMWKGWLSPSTPILANVGTQRGLPVSCAGNYMDDSIHGIYMAKLETAMLTKYGFGTSSYLGDVRPRGAPIFGGGKSSGVLPIIEGIQKDMEYVVQGTARRGSWAGYLPADHGDFDEVATYLEQHPDGNNIGWNISSKFLTKLEQHEGEALRRYQRMMKAKMITGKGYFFFPDKVNAKRPEWYVKHNLDVKAAQLCLPGDAEVKVAAAVDQPLVTTTLLDVVQRIGSGEILFTPTLNQQGEIELKQITNAAMTGFAPRLAVTFIESHEKPLETTVDHGIRTEGGEYVQAQHLTIGQKVYVEDKLVTVVDTFISEITDQSATDVGVTELIEIEEEDGQTWLLSPDQEVKTERGIVKASELVETDTLVK